MKINDSELYFGKYLFIISIIILLGLVKNSEAAGVLRVHPTNHRYFTDDSGKAIYLTGSHTWNSLIDSGPVDPPDAPGNAFVYDKYLDFLDRYGHNFIRFWTWELPKFNCYPHKLESGIRYGAPLPWQRSSSFVSPRPTPTALFRRQQAFCDGSRIPAEN